MLALLGSLNPDSPAPSVVFILYTMYTYIFLCVIIANHPRRLQLLWTISGNSWRLLSARKWGGNLYSWVVVMHVQVVAAFSCFPQEHAYCYPWINFSYRDAWALVRRFDLRAPTCGLYRILSLLLWPYAKCPPTISCFDVGISKFVLFMCSRRK